MSLPSSLAAIRDRLKTSIPSNRDLTKLTEGAFVSSVSDLVGALEETSVLCAGFPFAIPDDEHLAHMLASGALPASWCGVFATLHPDRPPPGLSAGMWQARLDAVLVFGDCHAHTLERLGWQGEALFALGGDWQTLDYWGAGWMLAETLAQGGKVIALGARRIEYQTYDGTARSIENEAPSS